MAIAKEMTKQLNHSELQVIALSVKLGYTNGSVGSLEWELDIKGYQYYNQLKDISSDIEEGFTQGFTPEWKLTFKRYLSIQL